VLEDNKTQLLIKEIHDCYRLYGTLGQQNSGSCYSCIWCKNLLENDNLEDKRRDGMV